MPTQPTFDYAVIRVVPRVEREEFINAGVVLFCRELRYLAARTELERERLAALDPGADYAVLAAHLASYRRICEGDRAAGPIAALSQSERFHWLTSPRSTVIQVSPVHSGLCEAPAEALERLFLQLVARPDTRPATSDSGSG